jgi:hypothetical protein
MGLGYLEKGIEVVLLAGLAIHLKDAWTRWRPTLKLGIPAAA